MQRNDILRLLSDHRPELTLFEVTSITLFGSVARDQAGPQSDVDILVEFDDVATFDRYMGLKIFLEDLLGAPIDLVTPRALKPGLRPLIEREAINVV